MKKTANAVIAALLAGGAALAADAPDFAAIDVDKNGYVSREEARTAPAVMEIFVRVDANKDNQLSTTEYAEVIKLLQG